MNEEVFKFHIQSLAFGWCRVLMLVNDKEILFNAEYLGPNPLSSFIDACAELIEDGGEYNVTWLYHDIVLRIEMEVDDKNMLSLDITQKDIDYSGEEKKEIVKEEWHETIPFETFVSAVIHEGIRVLNAFGLYGYYRSWMDHAEFPLANLLRIAGKDKEIWKGDSCCTNIEEEIKCIQELIFSLNITKETKMDKCTIYYESWQLQCCGDPFSVGDIIEWTCVMPTEYKNAHGIILDFEEEHHGFATHSITGTVSKIIVERSESPKGKKETWYDRAETIQEEIQSANGRESINEDNDTTEYTLWGYIVELEDVIVKPITEQED